MEFKEIYEKIIADPRYLANIEYGKPRKGHDEGTVKAHIADLEENLYRLLNGLGDAPGTPTQIDTFWKLLVLIHVHDTFKGEAKQGSAIVDPQSHASLARAYLAQYTDDEDMLQITQFHDIGYAIYRKLEDTGRFDERRFLGTITPIRDKDLFLLFAIIDACTPSKDRKMIRWFVERMNQHFPETTIRPEHILPGPDETPQVKILPSRLHNSAFRSVG